MTGGAEAHSAVPPGARGCRIRMAAASDHDPILSLLSRAGLPTADLSSGTPVSIWLAEHDGRTVGVIGLERYAATGLLRSLAVLPEHRGRGLGAALVQHLEVQATRLGVTELVLLTETAKQFFLQRGYRVIGRRDAPPVVQASAEFRTLCPAAAICMSKSLRTGGPGRNGGSA